MPKKSGTSALHIRLAMRTPIVDPNTVMNCSSGGNSVLNAAVTPVSALQKPCAAEQGTCSFPFVIYQNKRGPSAEWVSYLLV